MKYRTYIGVAFVLAACWYVFHLAQIQTKAGFEGKQAHDYLCYQKTVVIPSRIRATLKYEADVQLGLRKPIAGLTVADLAAGIKRDTDALGALRLVKCN